MAIDKEKYIAEAKMREEPKKPPFKFRLGDKCVKTKHIADKNVTPEKLSESVEKTWLDPKLNELFFDKVKPLCDSLEQKYSGITDELYTMIASLQVGGIALSDRLGDREDIGVNQKTLTNIINTIMSRIDDIAGEYTKGFSMVVDPDSFISEDTCTVNISAQTSTGMFDHIAFYVNDELVVEGDQISTLVHRTIVDDTCEIKCVANILGITYTKTKMVTKYYPFFIGAGHAIQDILKPENAREYHGSFAGDYDVTCQEGDRIIVLIPISQLSKVVRIDMNGYEIPMDYLRTTKYVIYTSKNTYREGVWNIDITNNEADVALCDIRKIDELFED